MKMKNLLLGLVFFGTFSIVSAQPPKKQRNKIGLLPLSDKQLDTMIMQ